MDSSQVTLSQALRNSEPVRPLAASHDQQQPRDDSAWRISVLSTLGPARSSEPAFGTMYSNNDDPPMPKEAQHNMRLVIKKEGDSGETTSDYKGQYRRWPGILLFLLMIAGAIVLITMEAQKTYDATVARGKTYELTSQGKRAIKDGKTNGEDIVSDDGQVGNPKTYTTASCEQPNYITKNGQLLAVAANGTEVPFTIKGVNWFGMETSLAVPFGLWENQENGTTAYEIASFLSRNKFNAIRLPISVENVLKNNPPAEGVINKQSNRAINIMNFTSTLQSIVQSLEYRKIGVLISMHTLTNAKSGGNWFDESLGVSQDDFLKAVGIVSKELCGPKYWNVIGLDLKNEPYNAEWGTGTDADFVVGAEKIAKVMHDNCPQWLAFVEGVVASHKITIDGTEMSYYDWWGGGLQKAGTSKPKLSIDNKLVWAPHYYTTAVSPQAYFYGSNTKADYSSYEELSDEKLKSNIAATMNDMFGYLIEERTSAVLLGEFAGLYTKDAHPLKTTKRTTDQTIAVMMEKGYAGGFMWSLNPESKYEYNPANVQGSFTEGLLEDDWLSPNTEFLNAFKPMDSLSNLRPLPCFTNRLCERVEAARSSARGSNEKARTGSPYVTVNCRSQQQQEKTGKAAGMKRSGWRAGVALYALALALALVGVAPVVKADAENHEYAEGDEVVIWVNKIGPFNNPQETYTYNSLPFCKAPGMEEPEAHALGIGEILEGNELFNSGQRVEFAVDTPRTTLCSQTLSDSDALKFGAAVDEHYWYQLSIDDLPVWGLVGKVMKPNDDPEYLKQYPVGTRVLYTHKKYSISYNGPHIIHVNLTYSDVLTSITSNKHVEFTYEVVWTPTDIEYENRFDRYLEDEFFEHQIHWFSIFNSFMMVIFLCGLVALILLRTLKNDYAKFAEDDSEELMMDGKSSLLKDDSNSGWKLLHGDVFRAPPYLLLFCALVGTGAQLLVLSIFVVLIAIVSSLYMQPGGIVSVGLTVYAFSSLANGYASGAFYHQFFYPRVSKDWIRAMCLSSSLLPTAIFVTVFFINALAIAYGTTYAIPFVTIVQVILVWFFVSCPLAVLGTILGRHGAAKSGFPCRVNKFPREIPEARWYLRPPVMIMLTGILPFGSIFIEMYFIFASFWSYKFYYVYGFMLLVFLILGIVTLCVTIVCTYFLLNSENYRWHWTSFAAAGSTAIYVFIYAIYFYFFKTNMSGFLQTCFYFGYMGLFCFAFFIMCGTIGYLGSSVFTKRIYRNIKCE